MRAGRILLVLLFVLGLLGVVFNGAAIYSRFFLLSVSILGIAWVWTRWSAAGLGLVRGSRVLRANVGDVFEENYELANNSLIPAAWIEILNQSRLPHAAGSRLITFMLGRQKRGHLAREIGLSGTPVIVRSDGAVIEGFRPREAIAAWLRGAKS